jgi:hypothetical protein
MSWLYAIQALAWSMVGFAGGWLVCAARRDAAEVKARIDEVINSPRTPRPPFRFDSRGLGVALIAWALLMTGAGVIEAWHQRDLAACQARFNLAVVQAQDARAKIGTEDRELNVARDKAMVTLVRTVLTVRTREESRAALERYVRTNDALDRRALELDEQRRRSSLPDPAQLARCR